MTEMKGDSYFVMASDEELAAIMADAHMQGHHDERTVQACPDCQNEKIQRETERDIRNHPNTYA